MGIYERIIYERIHHLKIKAFSRSVDEPKTMSASLTEIKIKTEFQKREQLKIQKINCKNSKTENTKPTCRVASMDTVIIFGA